MGALIHRRNSATESLKGYRIRERQRGRGQREKERGRRKKGKAMINIFIKPRVTCRAASYISKRNDDPPLLATLEIRANECNNRIEEKKFER